VAGLLRVAGWRRVNRIESRSKACVEFAGFLQRVGRITPGGRMVSSSKDRIEFAGLLGIGRIVTSWQDRVELSGLCSVNKIASCCLD